MRRVLAIGMLVGCALALSACTQNAATSSASSGVSHLKSDLYQARTAVLKYLAAQTGDSSTDPTVAMLKKYGFTPSKYTTNFTYFSNDGGVRFCIQATTPTGSTYKIYIENDSKFSNAISGECIAGTDY